MKGKTLPMSQFLVYWSRFERAWVLYQWHPQRGWLDGEWSNERGGWQFVKYLNREKPK